MLSEAFVAEFGTASEAGKPVQAGSAAVLVFEGWVTHSAGENPTAEAEWALTEVLVEAQLGPGLEAEALSCIGHSIVGRVSDQEELCIRYQYPAAPLLCVEAVEEGMGTSCLLWAEDENEAGSLGLASLVQYWDVIDCTAGVAEAYSRWMRSHSGED